MLDYYWIVLNYRRTLQSLFIGSLNCWTILHFSLMISNDCLRKHYLFDLEGLSLINGYRVVCYGKHFFIFFICLIQKDVDLHKVDSFSFEIHFEYQRKISFLFPASYLLDEESFAIFICHLCLFTQFYCFKLRSNLLLVSSR